MITLSSLCVYLCVCVRVCVCVPCAQPKAHNPLFVDKFVVAGFRNGGAICLYGDYFSINV